MNLMSELYSQNPLQTHLFNSASNQCLFTYALLVKSLGISKRAIIKKFYYYLFVAFSSMSNNPVVFIFDLM